MALTLIPLPPYRHVHTYNVTDSVCVLSTVSFLWPLEQWAGQVASLKVIPNFRDHCFIHTFRSKVSRQLERYSSWRYRQVYG